MCELFKQFGQFRLCRRCRHHRYRRHCHRRLAPASVRNFSTRQPARRSEKGEGKIASEHIEYLVFGESQEFSFCATHLAADRKRKVRKFNLHFFFGQFVRIQNGGANDAHLCELNTRRRNPISSASLVVSCVLQLAIHVRCAATHTCARAAHST